jgi:hypothetical protein
MINLNKDVTASDQVFVNFTGPGYYSSDNSLKDEEINLEKVAEEYVSVKDVKHFCKFNGYKVLPYLILSEEDIPSEWMLINQNNLTKEFYE